MRRRFADLKASRDDDWESLEEMIEATEEMINASEAVLEDAQAMRLPSRLALTLHQKAHTASRRLHRQIERVKIEKRRLEAREQLLLRAINTMSDTGDKLCDAQNQLVAELIRHKLESKSSQT
jgi:hypothetical protein